MEYWDKLYTLAAQVFEQKPWRYTYEDEIFGVKNPVTGKIGFISVMGIGEEHYAITVYLGERALMKFRELSEHHDTMPPETILEIPQLQLSFEDRDYLEKEDKEIIKRLDRKFRGSKAWPMFRAFRPGMFPSILNDEEQQSMIHYLEQVLVVLSDVKSPLKLNDLEDPQYCLVRDYKIIEERLVWDFIRHHIQVLPRVEIPYAIPTTLLDDIWLLKPGGRIYEADLIMAPTPIREKGKPGFFPYIFLLVDENSKMVLGQEILNPSDGLEKMYSGIPGSMLEMIKQDSSRPFMIYVNSDILYSIFLPVMKELKIRLEMKKKLPVISVVKKELLKYFDRGLPF